MTTSPSSVATQDDAPTQVLPAVSAPLVKPIAKKSAPAPAKGPVKTVWAPKKRWSTRKVLLAEVLVAVVLVALVSYFFLGGSESSEASTLEVSPELTLPNGYERTAYGTVTYTLSGVIAVQDDVLVNSVVDEAGDRTVSFQVAATAGEKKYYEGVLPENVHCSKSDPVTPVALTDVNPGDTAIVSWTSAGAPTLVTIVSSAACGA